MSDLMLYGVLRMPYEMTMENELSRRQFYDRVQEAAKRLEEAESNLAGALRALGAENGPTFMGEPVLLDRRATQPASAPADPWHKAAMEECMGVEGCYYPDDPARTIKELIDWHVKAPAAVSAPQGKAGPFPQTCPVMHDGACSDRSKCAKPCGDRQGQESPL